MLGYLSWYSVSSDTVADHKQFKENLDKQNLKAWGAKPPLEANIFRRACTALQYEKDGFTYYCKNHLDKDGLITRTVMRETSFGKAELGTISFDKKTKTISSTSAAINDPVFETCVDLIMLHYEQNQGKIDANQLRIIIRNFFEDTVDGALIRSGLFFVEKENLDTLKKIEEVVSFIDGCEIHHTELQDTQLDRNMLTKIVEFEIEKEELEFYDTWKTILEKPRQNILAKEITELETRLERIKLLIEKIFRNGKQLDARNCQHIYNELVSGVYKFKLSLESV